MLFCVTLISELQVVTQISEQAGHRGAPGLSSRALALSRRNIYLCLLRFLMEFVGSRYR